MQLEGFNSPSQTAHEEVSTDLVDDLSSEDDGGYTGMEGNQVDGEKDEANKEAVDILKSAPLIHAFTPSAWLLDPRSAFMRKWELILAMLLLYTSTVTPYEVAFLPSVLETRAQYILMGVNRFVDFCFVIDLFLNFNTSYFEPNLGSGMWIVQRKKICVRYLSTHFIVDLVSTLPFGLISLFVNSEELSNLRVMRIIRLLRLVKLLRIMRSGRLLRQFEENMSVDYNMMTLIKFVIMVVGIAHWLGCGFHLIVRIEENPINWVDNYFDNFGKDNPSAGEKYIAAFYWAFVTMSTIGYGDVTPASNAERVYELFAMLAGTSIFAYVVGSVCTIVGNMDKMANEFYELMDNLNAFMTAMNIDPDLRKKLRSFFRFRRRNACMQEYWTLLAKMSPVLRGEVATALCGKWVNSIPFFAGAPTEFLQEIAQVLQVATFPQGEKIINGGDLCDRLYIVQRGVVGGKGRIFTTGKVFGEDILCGDGVSTYTARALTYTDVYTLQRKHLEQVCEAFPVMRIRLLQTGVRKKAKEALTMFTVQWMRTKKGLPEPFDIKEWEENTSFLTPAKMALLHKQQAMSTFIQHMMSLDPRSAKPRFSLAIKQLNNSGMDVTKVTPRLLRQATGVSLVVPDQRPKVVAPAIPSTSDESKDKRASRDGYRSIIPDTIGEEEKVVDFDSLEKKLHEICRIVLDTREEVSTVCSSLTNLSQRITKLEENQGAQANVPFQV